MIPRQRHILLLLGGLFCLPSCASHYQDLLRDRDAEIRELRGMLADARSQSEDLTRRERAAQSRLDELLSRPEPVEAAAETGIAERLQEELGDETDVRYESGRLSIGIDNTVTFTSGSIEIKSTAGGVLQRVADVLRREFGGRRIFVEGHTDTDPIRRTAGTFRSNRHLSVERADAVARYLVSTCGLEEQRIAVVGYGQFSPRLPGSDEGAKSKNRRVEIVVGEVL